MALRRLIAVLMATIVTSGLAEAQSSFSLDRRYREVGDWIVGWNAERRYCLMLTGFNTGVVALIGVDPYKESGVLSFFKKEWDRVEEGRQYPLELVFDNGRRWRGSFLGTKAPFGMGFQADDLKLQFLRDIAVHNSVRISTGSRNLGLYSLAGTQAALLATMQCSRDNLGQETATTPPPIQPQPAPTPAQPPSPPRFGVSVRDLPADRKAAIGGYGLLVEAVTPDSIASMAGIKAGDVIRYMTGHQVTTPVSFAEAIRQIPANTSILIEILRGGSTLVLSVTFP